MSSRTRAWILVVLVASLLASSVVVWSLYQRQHTVIVDINGIQGRFHTRLSNTQAIVNALGVRTEEGDWAELTPRQELTQGVPLRIHVARTLFILVDGQVETVTVHDETVGEALARSGIVLLPGDVVAISGSPFSPTESLNVPKVTGRASPSEIMVALREPLQANLQRARSVALHDGNKALRVETGAATLGHALSLAGLVIYSADEASANPMMPTADVATISITRSIPIALEIGGEPSLARTCADSVQALLQQEQVVLGDLDYVRPSLGASLSPNVVVQVVRVLVERYVEEIPVAFEERWEPNPEIEIDQREIKHWGREGAERRLWQVRYENDQEVNRISQEQWTAREPIDRVIEYGTKIVIREVDTPSGTVSYWRKVRMLATSYNAPTAGKPMDHPTYGITRMGLRARKGIIAVDPRVIPLGQDLYVPGYGPGLAGDTGGAIKWRRIDLCFDDDNLELWKRWVDVYFVTPIPDESEITWVITNWPRERD